MKINKYWRLKRDDKELDKFIDFLKSEYNYVEYERCGLYPSKVYYIGVKVSKTIIVTLVFDFINFSNVEKFSIGKITINNKIKKLTINWKDDRRKNIVDFDSKYLRRKKLEKINNSK